MKWSAISSGFLVSVLLWSCAGAAGPEPLPADNEPPIVGGTQISPTLIELDTPYTIQWPGSSPDGLNYLAFTTKEAGSYYFDSDGQNAGSFDVYLYSDPKYEVLLTTITRSDFGDLLGTLEASRTYYLMIAAFNSYSGFTGSMVGFVASPGRQALEDVNYGTKTAPVDLAFDTTTPGAVGKNAWDFTSYYSFVTGNGGDYSLVIGGETNTLLMTVMSDAGFTSRVGSVGVNYGYHSLYVSLSPNTRYYLSVRNSYDYFDDRGTSYTLLLREGKELPIPLANGVTMEGEYAETWAFQWYELSVIGGKRYGATLLSGQASYVYLDIFGADKTAGLRSLNYSSAGTIGEFTVPAGDTKIYARVYSAYRDSDRKFSFKIGDAIGDLTVVVK